MQKLKEKKVVAGVMILDFRNKLMILFWVGWIRIVYGILSGEADFENATFGIFDYWLKYEKV